MKILLVDDDAFLRDMYGTKFMEEGHTVETAETAEVALDILFQKKFEVVLMDMIMPGFDGIDLLKKIKLEKLGGDPVCIILSNQSEESDKKEAAKAGAAGYIVKAEMIPSEVVKKVLEIVS